ncbi:hypothetical protein PFY12_12155 [Chryseobacterium camelliae]|uniref:Uncharacterized protein n=1 Tax=Chryseobacterium camelliae TaxID=1265445 RepID=A0ABY7QJB7_9FLAO|nr:hypothetical protein [Chryseobacterium camelliae]WBV59791.1 hypothetical protein PFY12_12155 [Chryseobacterium camelliae]
MKKTALFILTLSSLTAFAQSVSDYKYISLPTKFETFKEDFGLAELLTKTLRSKNYIVVPSDKLQWPSEAKDNPCNVLMADIINDSGFLRNKVLVKFKDCNDKEIQSIKGASNIKEYKEGYQDALKQTYVSISPSKPSNQIPVKAATTISATEEASTNSISAENSALKFSNGKMDLQKIQVDKNQFILVSSNSSSPFATFKNTTKNDVFRVKLQNGESTLGYFENGNIVIEIPQSDGEYAKEVFSKK